MAERLYIFDGYGYIFRAHYALMGSATGERKGVQLSTAEGMPTGALYVFARMLLRFYDDVRPERIAVVFDAGRDSFRKQVYPDYKANRSAPPDELVLQIPRFRPMVEAMGWPVLAIPGVEADDVVATLAGQARARGWEVVILSADKDLMQLVGEGVAMVDAMRQQTFTREAVIEKFGVPPERLADYLALCGDTSDNIPGVRGVGGKSAAKLVNEYPDIEAMIAGNPKVLGKFPLADAEVAAKLRISRQLVELNRQVEVGVELDALVSSPWDSDTLSAMFKELEFDAMVDRVSSAPAPFLPGQRVPVSSSSGPSAELGEPVVVSSAAELAALAASVRSAGRCGLRVETVGRFDRASLVGLGVAVPGQAPAYVPVAHRSLAAGPSPDEAALAPLAAVLADPAIAKLTHDGKAATRALALRGWTLAGVTDDAMLAAFLLDSEGDAEAVDKALAPVVGAALPPRAQALGKAKDFEASAPAEAAAWVGRVAEITLLAAPELARRVGLANLESVYRDVELPIARLLAVVERTGICIDGPYLAKLGADVGAQIAALEAQVRELVGVEINLGSPKQLAALLFETLGLEADKTRKTRTGFSVDHEVLEGLVDAHPAVKLILEHRELIKLKGTYLDALPPLVNPRTGRVHTIFNQVGAATGRLSSQDPNLQNIPIRSEVGRSIRRGFVAAPGKVLVAADYSQIELRILAHLSGDPLLSRAFRENIDVHTQTAAEVFGLPLDAIGARERRIAKAVNYGLSYGQGIDGLARVLDIPRSEAKDHITRYFERFPTIRKFMDDVVAEARARGGSRTVLGRWRPIPELKSKAPAARRAAERVAQNTPMQGSGADIIKLAMLRTTARLAAEQLDAPMLLTVHDELVFECAPDDAERVGALVKEEMEQSFQLDVPLVVDVGIARNWAEA
jgi:DNA polymerase-1